MLIKVSMYNNLPSLSINSGINEPEYCANNVTSLNPVNLANCSFIKPLEVKNSP